jgi:ABC-type glycerol-3-phosphate transport system substrate-binding protein
MKSLNRKYENIHLRLLSFVGLTYRLALKAFAREFEAETGATIEIISLPAPYGWWYLEPILQSGARSNDPQFDLFCDNREFAFQVLPHLLPLNPYIEESNYDMDGFLKPVYKFDSGVPGLPDTRVGLPIRIREPLIFYRKDLIKEFPTTWDEYERMLAEYTGGGMYGLAVEGIAYPYHPFGGVHDLNKLFMARYLSFGDPMFTPDWRPLITQEKGVEALEMLKRQVDGYAAPDWLTWGWDGAADAFLSGKAAVIETVGVHLLPRIQDPTQSEVVDKWAVGLYPGTGIAPYTLHNMLILKHCKHPNVAFDFIAYCTRAESARRLHFEYGEHSARKSVLTSPEAVARDPSLLTRVEALERAVPIYLPVPQCYEVEQAFWAGVTLCLNGYLPAKTALDYTAHKLEPLFRGNPPIGEYRE